MELKTTGMNREIETYSKKDLQARYEQEEAYIRAKKKVDKIVGFYWHLASYLVINIFLIILIYTKSGEPFFSLAVWSTPIFWGIGLLFHFLGVFGPDFLFSNNWEERKIEKFMKEEKSKKHWE